MRDEMETKPNSYHKQTKPQAALPEKKIEKVVTGTVKTKKKSELSKLADTFIADDIKNVGSYALTDILIPSVKKVLVEIITNGAEMLFFGETRRKDSRPGSYVSYRSYSDKSRDDRGSYRPETRDKYGRDDIYLNSMADADEVLDQMMDLIETYGCVSVADLNELVGKRSAYTDHKYGWKNLRNARAVRTRDGYLLDLPKVVVLD